MSGPLTPLDQGAFLEAIGVDPNEVMRDTTELVFEGDMVKVQWTGFKFVPVSKLIFALTEADEESKRKVAERATTTATPRAAKRPKYAEAEPAVYADAEADES